MERTEQVSIVSRVIQDLQTESNAWVDLARVGAPLKSSGIDFKSLGFGKLRTYLEEEFGDELLFQKKDDSIRPPVYYVKPKTSASSNHTVSEPTSETQYKTGFPGKQSTSQSVDFCKLYDLGYISNIDKALSSLQKISRDPVVFNDVIDAIAEKAEQGEIEYWERTKKGAAKCVSEPEVVAAKMIATPCYDRYNNTIFACFVYNQYRKSWTGIYFQNEQHIKNRLSSHNIGVMQFRNWEDANTFIKMVYGDGERRLLPGEEWIFGNNSDYDMHKTAFPILESYLKHYTVKLFNETNEIGSKNYGKVIFTSDKRKCLFNTGLLDRFANEIFIYGDTHYKPENRLVGIRNATCETGAQKIEQLGFENSAPSMLEFFERVDELVYDPNIKVDFRDGDKLEHIIKDNMKRFPIGIQKTIEENQLPAVVLALKSAAEAAEKIAARNYKYVVPQWRPQEKKIQFLMPIYLGLNYTNSPDFALVLNKGVNYYIPETILTLSMAYTNARLLCKPDETWLQPQNIEITSDSDEEAEDPNSQRV